MLAYLKEAFPSVDTVTSYARSKTCARWSQEEWRGLAEAGLTGCFVGIESGSDEVLDYMNKGVTMAEHIHGGRKVMEAGVRMAADQLPVHHKGEALSNQRGDA